MKLSFKSVPRTAYGLVAVIVFAGLGSVILGLSRASGNATLSLTPASSTIGLGSNVTYTIVENSGTVGVNTVEADLTYDQTQLQFVSITTGAAFPASLAASGGNGKVNIVVGNINVSDPNPTTPLTGQQTVATVTFTAIGSGSGSVAFANTSAIDEASDSANVLGTATSATYTVADTTAPTAPTGLSATTRTATSIALSWTAATDNVGVTGYNIYRGGTKIGTSTGTTYTDNNLSPSNSYTYTVAAYDAAGNVSAQSATLNTSTTADSTKPSTPTGLAMTAHTISSISLSWTAATDNVSVTGYRIYRGGTQIGTSTGTSYTASGLSSNTSYAFTIAAYDAAGNVSAQSSSSSFSTLADTTAPTTPTGLTSTSQTGTTIALSWTASTDNVGVTGYNIYRGGTKIGTSTTTAYTDSGLTAGSTYSYTVAAYDAAGNVSAQSSAKSVSTISVAGDANGDGKVTVQDFSILVATWQSTTDLRADFNHDGKVNLTDFSILASNWGR